MNRRFWIAVCLMITASYISAEEEAASQADVEQQVPTDNRPLTNIFLTGQYGGGVAYSLGGGFGFFDNVVRPEILFGYTPTDTGFSGFSILAKLNARLFTFTPVTWFRLNLAVGTGFAWFSGAGQVVSSAFLSQDFDLVNILGNSIITLYSEENLYFVLTKEGSLLFQLAIGVRLQPYWRGEK